MGLLWQIVSDGRPIDPSSEKEPVSPAASLETPPFEQHCRRQAQEEEYEIHRLLETAEADWSFLPASFNHEDTIFAANCNAGVKVIVSLLRRGCHCPSALQTSTSSRPAHSVVYSWQ